MTSVKIASRRKSPPNLTGPKKKLWAGIVALRKRSSPPFEARCVRQKSISLRPPYEQVNTLRMADGDDCGAEVFVTIRRAGRSFGVLPAQRIGLDLG